MGFVEAARLIMNQELPAGISQEQQQEIHKQQNQQDLKCPRCDSTNTKFCYYNNYSLSQPRHFCKACKRYWTRGGTLRNVPVGGGCSKNKRVRRLSSTTGSSSSSITDSSFIHPNATNSTNDLIINRHHPTSHHSQIGSDVNFSFLRYDIQNTHQVNGLGLGFQSSSCGFSGVGGFHIPGSKQIFQDLIFSNQMISNYVTTTTTTATAASTFIAPIMSSILANSLHLKASNNVQALIPSYDQDNLQLKGNGQVNLSDGMFTKEMKMELEGQNRSLDHHQHHDQWSNSSLNQMDQAIGCSSSDPSLLWGGGGGANGNNLRAWLDPSNTLGSSLPSLI